MFCDFCGKEIKDGVQFCPYCGAKPMPRAHAVPSATQPTDTAPESEDRLPYREAVEQNLESARKAARKNGPVGMIVSLILAALTGFNAYFLITQERGIYLVFVGVGASTLLCILFSALMIVMFFYSLINMLRNCNPKITEKRFAQFMDEVAAIGPEDQVFARVEAMSPRMLKKSELRFNESIITGTSPEEADKNFIAPMSALAEAGLAMTGNRNSTTVSLYLHVMLNNRKRKLSYTLEREQIMEVLAELRALRPDLKIMVGGKPMQ